MRRLLADGTLMVLAFILGSIVGFQAAIFLNAWCP
jgi:hypothetical protein